MFCFTSAVVLLLCSQITALSLRSTENCRFQYVPHLSPPPPPTSLDLAQLVEHTAVTVTHSLYGRWFDSGSRDDQKTFAETRYFAQNLLYPVADSFVCL